MAKSRIIDFNQELSETSEKLETIYSSSNEVLSELEDNSTQIDALEKEIDDISKLLDVTIVKGIEAPMDDMLITDINENVNSIFLDYSEEIKKLEPAIQDEIYKNPRFLPELSNLDIAIVGISGVIATIIDMLIVKLPKDMNYLAKYQQSGSDITAWLKSFGIDEKGKLNGFLKWLENNAKVSYDQSTNPGGFNNFFPGNHRLLSLGHDPVFGLIFGTIDILMGQMTVIDGKGFIHITKTFDMPIGDKVFAPIIWLAHIISDISTKRGIPIPGWGFTQLLQVGSFGEKNRTVADLTRWMYESGYDLRHFATMATVPASIEIIVRLYHYLGMDKPLQRDQYAALSDYEMDRIKRDLKLHKMLFASHTIASTGNAVKVFSMRGNPAAINIAEWTMLLRESIVMVKAAKRDKTPEKIKRNREKIDEKWAELSK